MSGQTAYCSYCGRTTPYDKKTVMIEQEVSEVKIESYPDANIFSYPEIHTTCRICGHAVRVPDVMFQNAQEYKKEYYKRLYSLKGGKH